MKELKCITIYPEVYNNKDLTPTEKIYLSVIRYFTLNGKTRCCRLSDKEMSEELLIGIPSIWNMKSKLKKLGLITIGENCIKYASSNNYAHSSNNEETSSNNEETSSNNEENPCNTNENQQVTEVNKYNKKEIKKEKNKKEIKEKEKQEKEKSFLDDWEREAMLKKKEYKDNSSNNSNSDSCAVVDMVMGLPVKEDVPIKDEPEIKIETDKETIIDVLAKKMVDKISYSIRTQVNQIKHECDKQMFLKENEFNELQLTKHIKEYLKGRDLDRILQDVTVFDRFAINAFNLYKNEIKRNVTKLPKKNPYGDLEDSNSSYNDYRETNRWEK